MTETTSPYRNFKEKICTFAKGQHGIRNPFVIAAVEPEIEHRIASRLTDWATDGTEPPQIPTDVTIQPIWLDELLPRTDVYKLLVDLREVTDPSQIEGTMQDRLSEELVEVMIDEEIEDAHLETQRHVVLLLHLGSLYPFSRASELLDELDRRNVKSTIGIPFPGSLVNQNLNFFETGESSRYYPAHQIDGKIREVHLQQ